MSDNTKTIDELERLTDGGVEDGTLYEDYKPVNQLHIPEEAYEHFDSLGFELRWVRIFEPRTQGTIDLKNIQKKEQEGYKFIKRTEVPGLDGAMMSYFGEEVTKSGHGLYVIGDMALAKVQHARVQSKRRYLEGVTRDRSQAIIDDLRRNNVMPNAAAGDEFRTVYNKPHRETRSVKLGKTGGKQRAVAESDSD